MITFGAHDEAGRHVVGIGLTAENLLMLAEYRPVELDLAAMFGLPTKLLIMFGETEEELRLTLAAAGALTATVPIEQLPANEDIHLSPGELPTLSAPLGQLWQGHDLVGQPCHCCHQPMAVGDLVGLVPDVHQPVFTVEGQGGGQELRPAHPAHWNCIHPITEASQS